MIQEHQNQSILLAEDDETLGYLLKEYLSTQDFEVNWVKDGAKALHFFNERQYALTILDVMMPALDGFTVAELIRAKNPNHPIIFLTAKSMHKDVERGFKAGADDYIKKPVNEEELVARIQAVIKRSAQGNVSSTGTQSFEVYQIGRYIFDSKKYILKYEEEDRTLTEMESNLLELLCENKNSLVQREAVLQKLWGRKDFLARKSMDVFISRLRKYLAKDKSIRIVNVHGSGFVLEAK